MLYEIFMFLLIMSGKGINPKNAEVLNLLQTRRIGHGLPASLGEFPYQVAIKTPLRGYLEITTYNTFCGGSIIKSKVVLSAAHCFIMGNSRHGRIYQDVLKNEFAVAGNIHNNAQYSIDDSDIDGQWRRIQEIRFPITFDFPIDDLALLYLRKSFTFDSYVSPIDYAKVNIDYAGYNCLASGYGKINDREQSEILRKAKLEVLSISTCNKLFDFRTEKMICTTDQISDVLEGDSGGPLVCTNVKKEGANGTRPVLVGIVSGGYTGVGSIFTRVSSFKRFIAKGKARSLNSQRLTRLSWIILLMLFCDLIGT